MESVFGRSQILKGRVDLIQDCYNANPDSVLAAIKMLTEMNTEGRRILVLGDMLELGEESEGAHRAIGRTLTDCPVDEIYLLGAEMGAAADECVKAGRDVYYSEEYRHLEKKLLASIRQGDLILLKGSRGMELERLTALLVEDAELKIS
jgi:UDP-N-acetylmuramoyl-tripeptide--D-alanyl-D-alanine ligase